MKAMYKEKYPWLGDSDERMYMTDREIQVHRLGQVMFDRFRKGRSKRYDL